MNEENPFNTAGEEVKRLVEEFRETKEAVRDVSKRLSQIEVRMQRSFPSLMPAKRVGRARDEESAAAEPTLTPEQAIKTYDEMVELARKDDQQSVHERLTGMGLADLNLLRRELGTRIGKKKASRRVLEEAIIGRIRESVLMSKHSNREKTANQVDLPPTASHDDEEGK